MKDLFVWLVNTLALASGMWITAPEVIDKFGALKQVERHFCKLCPDWLPSSALSWERRAPARLQKPRWSVALPGQTLEHWQWMYKTDI